jgi:hypothetical protein
MSKSKLKKPAANVVDLGLLQIECEESAQALREAQDAKIEADRAFLEARGRYLNAGSALEMGLGFVKNTCLVTNLIGG